MIIPLCTKNSLAEAKRVFNEKRNFKRKPEVDWRTVDRVIDMQKLIRRTNPLTRVEESFVDEITPELLEKELEEQMLKPGKKSKYVTLTQENALYKQFLSNKKQKMRSLAQPMVQDIERKMCMQSFLLNIFPIFTGNNAYFIGRLNHLQII